MIINIQELSKKLNISTSGIYAWVSQKKIPYVKVGHLIRFDSDDIDEWLKQKKIKPRV